MSAALRDGRACCIEQPKEHECLIVLYEIPLKELYAADLAELISMYHDCYIGPRTLPLFVIYEGIEG